MLINFTNHPSTEWPEVQLKSAGKYGSVFDVQFPSVDPIAEPFEIEFMAEKFEIELRRILAGENNKLSAVHIMGELTFCFALVSRLQMVGIICLASTTIRETIDYPDGSKTTKFGFVRFREYLQIHNSK